LITEQDWEKTYEQSLQGRRLVVDDFWRAFGALKRKKEMEEIDQRARAMKKATLDYNGVPKAKWRHLGKQSLLDVPVDVPLEKIMRDQAGLHHEYGAPWVCDFCGAKSLMGLPPDKCPACGKPSLIVRKLINLRA
jgi:rubrerythrin